IVESLADYWSACGQIRAQLSLLTFKYPVDIEIMPPGQGFRAKTVVLFPAVKAKAHIYFIFSSDAFSRWPVSIGFLRHEVEVLFGTIDQSTIFKAISDRLDQARPGDNFLVDACIVAQEVYEA
ncbi:hypothetical protein B0H13DRAFT_1924518, partial [Mycena leptocephala]